MAKVTRSRVGITTYLIPGASLNASANVESLRENIDACVADNEFELILDLSGVGVVNSEALELLLDTQDRLTRVGGQLRVTHANAVITDVLRLTGIAAIVGSLDEDSAPAAEPAPKLGEKRRRIGELMVARGLVNYWGYNTLGYFAPAARYASVDGASDVVREFKTMVHNLHAAGPRRPLERPGVKLGRSFHSIRRRPPSVAWVVAGLGLMLGAPASAALMIAGGIGGVWDYVFLHLAFAGGALIVYCETVGQWR